MVTLRCKTCQFEMRPEQADQPCPRCGKLERELGANDQLVFTEKARVAQELARKHYQVEPGLTRVIRFSGAPSVEAVPCEPIKLLEVNHVTVPSGVMPLHFGPSVASGIPFPSVIIEVTPDEYQKIQAKELKLPDGWNFPDELMKPTGS